MITATATLGSTITATAQIANQTVTVNNGDVTAPTFSAGPASANVDDTSFDITATLNEWGTVYSLVQAAADAAPSVATVIATGESAIDTGSGVTINHTGLTASTDYTAYVVAKDDDDNTQASVTDVDVTTDAGFDADAATWIAAGSFSAGNQTILDTFVLNLKTGLTNATNVWSDITALYVMCWGSDASASNNAINGKNPGTYDLTFVNSPTHGSAGVAFNGSTQYARSGITPSSHLTIDDITLSGYTTTNQNDNDPIIGAINGTAKQLFLVPRDVGGEAYFPTYDTTVQNRQTNADSSQLVTGTVRSSTDKEIYRNASSLGSDNTASSGSLVDFEMYISARNNAGSAQRFKADTFRVVMAGAGMSSNQVADWSAAVDALMTDLGI